MEGKKITIIGAGNLGTSFARGLIAKSVIPAANITLTNIDTSLLLPLQEELHVNISTSNTEAVAWADIVLVAVKPHIAPGVFMEIAPVLSPQHLLISVVSGLKIDNIQEFTGTKVPLVRVMPNTAMTVCDSMTAVSPAANANGHTDMVIKLFSALGIAFEVPESQMPAATVLASCGIAFALRFMRAMATGGIEIGFRADLAHEISAQIMKGASRLIQETGHHPEREIDKVTTPMGVTISGLNEMDINGLTASVVQGIRAAFHKIQETEKSH